MTEANEPFLIPRQCLVLHMIRTQKIADWIMRKMGPCWTSDSYDSVLRGLFNTKVAPHFKLEKTTKLHLIIAGNSIWSTPLRPLCKDAGRRREVENRTVGHPRRLQHQLLLDVEDIEYSIAHSKGRLADDVYRATRVAWLPRMPGNPPRHPNPSYLYSWMSESFPCCWQSDVQGRFNVSFGLVWNGVFPKEFQRIGEHVFCFPFLWKGFLSFAQQNAGIFTSTPGQSFLGSSRCARTAESEGEPKSKLPSPDRRRRQFRHPATASRFPCRLPAVASQSTLLSRASGRSSWLHRPRAFLDSCGRPPLLW